MNIIEISLVLFFLLIYLLFPYACYKLAEKKGMNKTIAFIVGFLAFPALIYYFHCPSKEEREEEEKAKARAKEEKELKKP